MPKQVAYQGANQGAELLKRRDQTPIVALATISATLGNGNNSLDLMEACSTVLPQNIDILLEKALNSEKPEDLVFGVRILSQLINLGYVPNIKELASLLRSIRKYFSNNRIYTDEYIAVCAIITKLPSLKNSFFLLSETNLLKYLKENSDINKSNIDLSNLKESNLKQALDCLLANVHPSQNSDRLYYHSPYPLHTPLYIEIKRIGKLPLFLISSDKLKDFIEDLLPLLFPSIVFPIYQSPMDLTVHLTKRKIREHIIIKDDLVLTNISRNLKIPPAREGKCFIETIAGTIELQGYKNPLNSLYEWTIQGRSLDIFLEVNKLFLRKHAPHASESITLSMGGLTQFFGIKGQHLIYELQRNLKPPMEYHYREHGRIVLQPVNGEPIFAITVHNGRYYNPTISVRDQSRISSLVRRHDVNVINPSEEISFTVKKLRTIFRGTDGNKTYRQLCCNQNIPDPKEHSQGKFKIVGINNSRLILRKRINSSGRRDNIWAVNIVELIAFGINNGLSLKDRIKK